MESKATIIIKENIKHVKYDNLYFINNEYVFLTTNTNAKVEPVYTMGGALDKKYNKRFKLLPTIKLFSTIEELKSFIYINNCYTIDGITNCLTHYWDHNISHGLYDALYPIFLTLLRFYSEKDKFNIFIDVIKIPGWKFPGHASREYNLDIFKTFSKGKILLKEQNKNYKFDTLIAGSGYAGISGVNMLGIMPGKDISALDKFRDRMFEVYDIKPVINNKLNITIIDSDRYSHSEKETLKKLNQNINTSPMQYSQIISWYNIKSFKEQLKIINSTDIHISGAGSSMLNFPFLNKGKIHINLGVNQINPVRRFGKDACTMPGLLEINICLLPNTIFVDFYNIYKYGSILYEPLVEIVQKNINNFNKEQTTNIPNYVLKWRKLCSDNPEKMQQLIQRMTYPKSNYPDLVPIRFMDVVVAGFSPYGNKTEINELLL
jgi:hypothetical protein